MDIGIFSEEVRKRRSIPVWSSKKHQDGTERSRSEVCNHVWAYDFVSTFTHDGRTVRMLNLIDEYTRECLAIRVERSLNRRHEIEFLPRP